VLWELLFRAQQSLDRLTCCDWWVVHSQTKDVWKSITTVSGELCVMIGLTTRAHPSHASVSASGQCIIRPHLACIFSSTFSSSHASESKRRPSECDVGTITQCLGWYKLVLRARLTIPAFRYLVTLTCLLIYLHFFSI